MEQHFQPCAAASSAGEAGPLPDPTDSIVCGLPSCEALEGICLLAVELAEVPLLDPDGRAVGVAPQLGALQPPIGQQKEASHQPRSQYGQSPPHIERLHKY